jgi:hypothetical protein
MREKKRIVRLASVVNATARRRAFLRDPRTGEIFTGSSAS